MIRKYPSLNRVKGSVIFTGRGALEIFQVLQISSDPPTVGVKFF